MKKIICLIAAISVIFASCVGKKSSAHAENHAYRYPEIEEFSAPVKRHNRW